MKKTFMTLMFFGFALVVKSQNASVEKSTFGIQTGFAGIWAYNELKLANQLALRTEIGLDAYDNDDYYPETGFLLTTGITIEPRWYYNLNKRESQSKQINGNSGDFFSLKTSFHHNDLLIKFGNDKDTSMVNNLSIIPTWGIRRNLGNHFNYETGLGVGYIHHYAKDAGFSKDKGEMAINLHLRIGYRF
ncbi:hypothetical protein [Flavivirga eckloniae]|uniref:DUF3575 domain-containing protein n=1 Tax=Flavivirga eckloniae TaxID=1803846 RepID=A0A2K9PR72_9FLAO|nr:hypothetical protein [Flavivirga eckloniae]AUP79570.1 hypothetical protein C1H87_12975 [Flavivirga eckloniae]